jgi:transposase-like protein
MGRSKMRLNRPRLRSVPDAAGKSVEIEPPAYTTLKRDGQLAQRMAALSLGCDVSTRKYNKAIEQATNLVGVSKSQVSRALKKAMASALEELQARKIPGQEILVVYIDGFMVGGLHVLGAIGVKKDGTKMVLGVRQGASENLTVATQLLGDLRDRGLTPEVPRLFVLDGGKALRSAVDGVYGHNAVVQRCRNHKRRNVLDYLPEKQRPHAKLVLRAAFAQQDAGKGITRLREYAAELERSGESSAAASLREGLKELFTINALGLPAALCRCLGTTNVLDAAHSGTRGKLRRVTNWQDGDMAVRWVAAAMVETEKSFRRIHGHQQLWILEANLKQHCLQPQEESSESDGIEKLANTSTAA